MKMVKMMMMMKMTKNLDPTVTRQTIQKKIQKNMILEKLTQKTTTLVSYVGLLNPFHVSFLFIYPLKT